MRAEATKLSEDKQDAGQNECKITFEHFFGCFKRLFNYGATKQVSLESEDEESHKMNPSNESKNKEKKTRLKSK